LRGVDAARAARTGAAPDRKRLARVEIREPFRFRSSPTASAAEPRQAMTLCAKCGKRDANVFLVQIIGSAETKTEVCEECAKEMFGPDALRTIASKEQEAELLAFVDACLTRASRTRNAERGALSARDIAEEATQTAREMFGPDAREKLWEIQIFSTRSFETVMGELLEAGHDLGIRREIVGDFTFQCDFDEMLKPA
jgi:hypothetical protein